MKIIWIAGWSCPSSIWDVQKSYWNHFDHQTVDFLNCHTLLDIEQAVKNEIQEPTILVASSLGTLAALKIAAQYSQIKKLFLIGATPCFIYNANNPYGWKKEVLKQMQAQLDKKDALLNKFDTLIFSKYEQDDYLIKWREQVRDQPISKLALNAGLNYLLDTDTSSILKKVKIPTYLLTGEADAICPIGGAKQLEHLLPQAELTIWPATGHLPFWTQEHNFSFWMKERV